MKKRFFCGLTALLLLAVPLTGCEDRVEPTDRTPSEVSRVESPQDTQTPGTTAPAVPALTLAGPDEGKNSRDEVTAHVAFEPYAELVITRPVENIELNAESYYITGISNPGQPLLLDGEEVEHRGELGSFGVYVALEEGENTFTFSQDAESAAVTITRSEESGEYSLTDKITRMRPEWDAVARAGEEYLLSCVAPSGAKVTAKIGEQTIELEQRAATAVEAVPATFLANLTPAEVDGTVNLGAVVYTLELDGETTEYPSDGELYVVGKDSRLLVRAVNASATAFAEESDESDYYTLLMRGAVDEVKTIGESMYELAMGGWVYKDAVLPLTDTSDDQNAIAGMGFAAGEKRDTIVLTGTSPAPYKAEWSAGAHTITLYHTTGLGELSVEGSALLDRVDVVETGGNTVLTFHPKESVKLGGYLVAYDGNNTVIYIKPELTLTEGAYPLLGVTIALDPGHGGDDDGAAGVARDEGPKEREINLAAAVAVRQYLRGLGASVVMTREDDSRVDMNDRLDIILHPEVDIAISLHANSIEAYLDGTGPSGTETYYYDPASEKLAEAVNNAICTETGRNNRGAKNANYKATLSSYSPTIMVEMGFLTNPEEYDDLCGGDGIYGLARAVGDGVLEALG